MAMKSPMGSVSRIAPSRSFAVQSRTTRIIRWPHTVPWNRERSRFSPALHHFLCLMHNSKSFNRTPEVAALGPIDTKLKGWKIVVHTKTDSWVGPQVSLSGSSPMRRTASPIARTSSTSWREIIACTLSKRTRANCRMHGGKGAIRDWWHTRDGVACYRPRDSRPSFSTWSNQY